jgi:hypothetical protein
LRGFETPRNRSQQQSFGFREKSSSALTVFVFRYDVRRNFNAVIPFNDSRYLGAVRYAALTYFVNEIANSFF